MKTFDDIRLLRITYLRGPNLWTYRSALEVWLDLGELEQHPSDKLPGFVDRLLALLPALEEHHCGVGERGGFIQRLRGGTWMGHVLEHVIIELLNLAGMPTGFGQTRSTSKTGVYRMVFRARDEAVARCALQQGHALLMAAINGREFGLAAAVQAVRDAIDDAYLGPSTAHIVASATERRIPHLRLNEGNLVQLGHGKRQHRIWTAETDRTSAIAEGIARDKDLTKRLLASVGVPVPEGRVAASAAEAWDIAEDVGLPVAVKPSDGNHGRGVTLDLTTREQVEAAYAVADAEGSEVIVERYIPGDEHRLLVVAGEVVAAARGEAAWVVGDGRSTVFELVESQLNSDPRRGETEDHPLGRIRVREDGAILVDLRRQNLGPDDVPAAGRRVLIQRNGNVAIDCTDDLHPDFARIGSLAARTVGLDIAGIDLVAQDISRPLRGQHAAVVEVNAGPGLLAHTKPAVGSPRPVGQAIIDHLFPPGDDGRIPIVGIAGGEVATPIARLVAWLLQLSGHHVGLACRDGLFLDTRRIDERDATRGVIAERLLLNREVDAAVFENGAATILDEGLVYDRCRIGVVTDLDGAETLERHDIHGADDLPRVLRTQMDVVLADGIGVLNADDPRVAALAEHCDGEVTLYATDAAVLADHRERGGHAVLLREGRIWLCEGHGETPLAVRGRNPLPDASVLLPAVAAAWAFGLAPALLAAGLDTFDLQTPADIR
ncbi:cyanophycin synthetase [Rubrivivax gelatinosus]|uniref:Cyanophycin synthetase n=1 Tax=Rubrivivax gelatinosus (strain NBRC 100245 / IL144) TaxID=983917 RepID=I0HWG1_RUBGI|nr:cyanophycin synthetase [Rubrivivax gelatinosus]MBG6079269.1 cyanophycin synthetase [Rubrivivax gelatinosus]BAL97348.1 cyanophycin synthetase [Rubrivivax gelatinosus IL144]